MSEADNITPPDTHTPPAIPEAVNAKKLAVNTPDYSQLMLDLNASFATGKTRSFEFRDQQLAAIGRMVSECEEEFTRALKADLNKPAMESWLAELSYVGGDVAYYRKKLRRLMKPRRIATPMMGKPGKSWIQPEPLGVVLIIGAWNYPLQLILGPLTAAVAAGNCAVLKPSELAPATSAALARRIPEYLDTDCIRLVEGSIPETTGLLEQHFDHMLYTGGGSVGRIVMSAAAKYLTPLTLELGGKSPCVVLPDANLDVAAKRIAWGKFMNAGQTCIAPDYILTDETTEARLLLLLDKHISQMFGDDPEQSESFGRIINDRHFERVRGLLDSGEAVIGGRCNADTKYIAPSVLTGVAGNSPVLEEEIFGPVLPIVRIDGLDQAIAYIREKDKPLAAYIFTGNRAAEEQFLAEVSSGNACVNDVMMFTAVPELPFGGVGESGMGCYKGEHGFRTFSHFKAVMRRGWWPDPALRYAPFTESKFKMMRRLR